MNRKLDLGRVDMAGVRIPRVMRIVIVNPENPGTPLRHFAEELVEQLRRGTLRGDIQSTRLFQVRIWCFSYTCSVVGLGATDPSRWK